MAANGDLYLMKLARRWLQVQVLKGFGSEQGDVAVLACEPVLTPLPPRSLIGLSMMDAHKASTAVSLLSPLLTSTIATSINSF
jgi:hypothetical protein